MINLKTEKELSLMREGGSKLAEVMERLKSEVRPGKTTKSLDGLARRLIDEKGGKPSFLNYKGFPAAICTSVNDTVVHGVPSDYELKEGDIISIDAGLEWKGYHTDMAATVPVGEISESDKKLIKVCRGSLKAAIEATEKGGRLGDLEAAIQDYVESKGFVVVEGLCGHGIGKEVHEDPQVMNKGEKGTKGKLKEGFTFCPEPMITTKNPQITKESEGIKTENRSAHFEHTLAITDQGVEILTVK